MAGVLSLKAEPYWGGQYQQALTKEALSAVVSSLNPEAQMLQASWQACCQRVDKLKYSLSKDQPN